MARWKLIASHYLNVRDEEWEYTEMARGTGRTIRKKFNVPRHLDVNDPSCWTERWGPKGDEEGCINVCHEGKGNPGDITFFGEPTPEMLPLDDEAAAISASYEAKWKYRPDEFKDSYSQSLVEQFQGAMADAQSRIKPIEIPGLGELTTMIGELVKQNQQAIESATRRV